MESADNNEVREVVGQGPGERLKSARLARNMSLQQVQVALRLDERTLVAIEEDNYSHFSAPIFVKGYLRSYARLVELNENQVLADFEATGLDEPPPLVPLAARGDAVNRTIPWRVVYTIVPVLLIVAAALWVFQKSPAPGSDVPLEAPEMLSRARPELSAESDNVLMEQDAPAPGDVTHLPDGQIVAETELVPETPVEVVEPEPEPQVSARLSDAVEAVDTGLLQLTVSEKSWVEVTDAAGRRLIFGLLKPGQIRRVSGRLPYRVLIGNAPGVSVDFDGRPYDYSRFARRNVARFEIDGN